MRDFSFFKYPASIEKRLRDLKTKSPSVWEKQGDAMALKLFQFASTTVPAYQAFLRNHGINPKRIRTIADFKTLPVTDKNSYLRAFPYEDLFPHRDIAVSTTIAATSGSTGEPFYFPRGEMQDAQYEYVAELFLKNQFEIDTKRTLAVIGFGLGIWIGGIFTYKIVNRIAARNKKLTLIPVGPNKELFLKSLKKFAPYYDQVILMGYPPFIKDIVDEAPLHGIRWRDYRIRILTATEVFSEDFREYLAAKASLQNSLTDVINIYGTVELGTMAHETALTTLIRKLACKDPRVFKSVFSDSSRLPTLAQYHPALVYFEQYHDEVIGSGFGSSLPLVRYRFLDRGEVLAFEEVIARLRSVGIDMLLEARKHRIANCVLKLPFVYVYERSDSTTTLFGINIYTEYLRAALEAKSIAKFVTGKLTMITKNDKDQNQFLEVNVEMKKGVRPSKAFTAAVQDAIVHVLLERSTEYHYLYHGTTKGHQTKLKPKIIAWSYGHALHFGGGGKQKWVKK